MRPLDWYLCAAIVVLIGLWWLSMSTVARLRREVGNLYLMLRPSSTQRKPKMPLSTEPPAAVGKIGEGAPRRPVGPADPPWQEGYEKMPGAAQHLSTRATGPDYDPGDSSVAAPRDDGLCILCFHAPHGPILRGTRLDVCEKSCADYGCPAWRAGADLRRPTWGIS